MDDFLVLISNQPKIQDENGIWRTQEPTKRTVFCKRSDITRQEFFNAGRNGLAPEFVVTVFHGDYEGERDCIFHEQGYSIYRTFRPTDSDYVELYLQKTAGTN